MARACCPPPPGPAQPHLLSPQVGNLGLLFMLLFFIYAALGVELFGKLGEWLPKQAWGGGVEWVWTRSLCRGRPEIPS